MNIWMDLRCDICRQFTAVQTKFLSQNQSKKHSKPAQLPEVLCGSIMCTTSPNNNLCLIKATGMDTNGYDMLKYSNFALSKQ